MDALSFLETYKVETQKIITGIENTLGFGIEMLFEGFDTITQEELEEYHKVCVERIREWLEPMLKRE